MGSRSKEMALRDTDKLDQQELEILNMTCFCAQDDVIAMLYNNKKQVDKVFI